MKAILIVCDGLGDRPIKELGDKTPLEAAKKPNLDKLAREGICGLMHTIGVGMRPGSDTSHLSIFGYDPKEYYHGRGPFEAAGIGMDLKPGDIAFRGNMGTVDDNLVVLDRRAGRIGDTTPYAKALDGMEIDGVKFKVNPGTGYRVGVVMKGRGLSSRISDPDPHELGVKVFEARSLDGTKEAKFTANVLNKFLAKAHEILKALKVNEQRIKEGNPPGNYLLVRGAGYVADVPTFEKRYGLKAACIAGAGLYKGVARFLGMDVIKAEGATGLPDTNVESKFKTAKNALKQYDFIFIHVKAADSLAEDGNYKGKKEFIEKIDKATKVLLDLEDTLVIITADHTTPCTLKTHSGDPVPLLMNGPSVRVDDVKEFGERSCAKGGLGHIKGLELMPEILNLIGKAPLVGA
ncbi:MAG: 2,3-bisphosphoglycerate-independent phosphoglycerate mutase [Candidatus Altiarchaeota archaeon]